MSAMRGLPEDCDLPCPAGLQLGSKQPVTMRQASMNPVEGLLIDLRIKIMAPSFRTLTDSTIRRQARDNALGTDLVRASGRPNCKREFMGGGCDSTDRAC